MTRFACDLHIHSCLSPCADDDMTPYTVAGIAKLNGLDMAALCDHNSCANVKVFLDACRHYGIIGVPGMELTTAEDIHAICLFPTLEQAKIWDETVERHRVLIRNRAEIYGRQVLIGADDEPCGEEEHLLVNATTLSLSEAAKLVRRLGGAFYPAHIDREANGILAILGALPEEPNFPTVERRDGAAYADRRVVKASDAHRPWEILEDGCPIELAADKDDAQGARDALIQLLEEG
jgi:hypothetical protein